MELDHKDNGDYNHEEDEADETRAESYGQEAALGLRQFLVLVVVWFVPARQSIGRWWWSGGRVGHW